MVPKAASAQTFGEYQDEIQKTLVWTGSCSRWYKRGTVNGRVSALFAGRAVLFRQMLSEIRSEHYDIVYISSNPFRFMGSVLVGTCLKIYFQGFPSSLYTRKRCSSQRLVPLNCGPYQRRLTACFYIDIDVVVQYEQLYQCLVPLIHCALKYFIGELNSSFQRTLATSNRRNGRRESSIILSLTFRHKGYLTC